MVPSHERIAVSGPGPRAWVREGSLRPPLVWLLQPHYPIKMKPNVGGLDRIVRIVGGLVILGAGYYYKSWWGLIGIVPLLTAVFRFCPAYLPFGLSSCSSKSEPKA